MAMYGLTKKQMSMCKDVWKDSDGYWAVLVSGFVNQDGGHTIHEDDLKHFHAEFKRIRKEGKWL